MKIGGSKIAKKGGFSSLEPSSGTVSSFSWIFVPDINSPDKYLSNDVLNTLVGHPVISRHADCQVVTGPRLLPPFGAYYGRWGDISGVRRKRFKVYVQMIIYWYDKSHGNKYYRLWKHFRI